MQYSTNNWQIPYWVAFAISGVSVPMVMFFVPESVYDRDRDDAPRPDRSTWDFWWKSLFGLVQVTKYSGSTFQLLMQPFAIMFSPLCMISGLYLCIIFGWSVGIVGLEPIFL
jgi:hypothetical protein